jgi:hypothetical protein
MVTAEYKDMLQKGAAMNLKGYIHWYKSEYGREPSFKRMDSFLLMYPEKFEVDEVGEGFWRLKEIDG